MRRALVVLFSVVILAPASGQDRVLRAVAFAEAVAPAVVLLAQGTDGPLEASIAGGAALLHTAPNLVLLLAEDANAPRLTRVARFVSAAAGLLTGAASLGLGAALMAGAFPDLGTQLPAGALVSVSVPALAAGFVDLLPYSVERRPPQTPPQPAQETP